MGCRMRCELVMELVGLGWDEGFAADRAGRGAPHLFDKIGDTGSTQNTLIGRPHVFEDHGEVAGAGYVEASALGEHTTGVEVTYLDACITHSHHSLVEINGCPHAAHRGGLFSSRVRRASRPCVIVCVFILPGSLNRIAKRQVGVSWKRRRACIAVSALKKYVLMVCGLAPV